MVELVRSLVSLVRDCVDWFTRGARQRQAEQARKNRLLDDMAGLPPEAMGILKAFAVNRTHTLELNPWDKFVDLLKKDGYLIPGPRDSSSFRQFFRVRPDVWNEIKQWHEAPAQRGTMP